MLKLEKSQYKNFNFQLNYTRYEKDVMIENFYYKTTYKFELHIFS